MVIKKKFLLVWRRNVMQLNVDDVSFGIREKQIIANINLHAKSGEIVGIIGPNGSGKSTLLKNIYRVNKPDAGKISLNYRDIHSLTAKETAQNMAVVRQDSSSVFDFSVKEIVLIGRATYKNVLDNDTRADDNIADEVLRKVGVYDYVNRSITTLSGGEKQRVMIARALAQQAKVFVLDELTIHLAV